MGWFVNCLSRGGFQTYSMLILYLWGEAKEAIPNGLHSKEAGGRGK